MMLVEIEDDDQCKRILLDVALLDNMYAFERMNRRNIRITACGFEYKGHWCLAKYWWGFPESKDNGFSITMIPKSMHTREKAEAFFQTVLNKSIENRQHITFKIQTPEDN